MRRQQLTWNVDDMDEISGDERSGEDGDEEEEVPAPKAPKQKPSQKPTQKPTFEEVEKDERFGKLVDEYYKLDYEDIVRWRAVLFFLLCWLWLNFG